MAEGKSGGLLGGIIIGTAVGAIAGLLAAPRPGKDTRRILKKSADALPELAEDLSTSIQFQADRLSATGLQNWDKTLSRLKEAVVAGQAASRYEWKNQHATQSEGYQPESYQPENYQPESYQPESSSSSDDSPAVPLASDE